MPALINILLVDDEPRNLDALESSLAEPEYRFLRAESAEKALRLLLDNDVAAIVLDVKMPIIDGFELAKLIKGTKKFREIPIVFLTAHLVDENDVVTGYGAGAVDYLTKPVNPRILRHKVAVFADLFRKTRALAELNETLEARVLERTAELERSEAALRSANKQKDIFLTTLAHELRNPLAPLRVGLDTLLRGAEQTAERARTLAAMNRQLNHIIRIVDDLLDVSRISRGTLDIRKETVDLGRIVERALETVAPFFERRGQSVAVDAPEPVPALVDSTRITQIIGNLLHNASKHSPAGATVQVELRRADDSVIIRVVDQGEGIPSDQIGRLFDMFTQIERSAKSPNDGLGVGLALSRKIAELHGGTLTVSSPGEGAGATFTLTLPCAAEPHVEAGSAPSERAPASRVRPLHIVVVEDNEDSADVMTLWLTQLGHEVEWARTGPQGVTAIVEGRPDLVFCDIGLPEMSGVEVCRRVMAQLDVPPVMVALTGWGMQDDRQRTAEAGFHYHLVKPVELDQLHELLHSAAQVELMDGKDGSELLTSASG